MSWTKYQVVTVDSTQVSSDLTDFVVYLALSDLDKAGSDIFDTVRSDGGDIRVTKSDGTTELPREIVAIDTTGKTGEVWIKYDGTLSSSSDTDIWIWYNGTDTEPAADSTYGSENVWTDYTCVLHMQEAVNNDANGYNDSSGNGNHGTGTSMTETAVAHLEGLGQSGAGGADGIQVSDNTTAGQETEPTIGTYQMWVSADSLSSFSCFIDTGTGTTYVRMQRASSVITINGASSTTDLATDGSWQLVHGVFNDTADTSGIWIDGGDNATGSPTLSKNAGGINLMYFPQNTTHSLNGQFDEFRIRGSQVSSAWVASEWTNQNTPNTFYTTGDEQTGSFPASSFIPKVIIY